MIANDEAQLRRAIERVGELHASPCIECASDREFLGPAAPCRTRRIVDEITKSPDTRHRRHVTPAVLQSAAEIYCRHFDGKPVAAIQATFGTSYRTAARYVQLARRDGYLAPTSQGRKQA